MEEKRKKLYKDVLILGTLLITIAFAIFNQGINLISVAVKPLIFALVLYYLLKPLVSRFSKKMNHTLSVVITFIILLLILTGFLWAVVPVIINSIESIINLIKTTTPTEFLAGIDKIPVISNYIDTTSMSAFFETVYALSNSYLSNIMSYSTTLITSVTGWIASWYIYIIGALMTFYLLRDSEGNATSKTKELMYAILPTKISDYIVKIADVTDESIRKYIVGKLYTSVIFGILIFVLCLAFNIFAPISIPYIALIAIIIAIGNLIPYVGSIVATIPCIVLCLFTGIWETVAFLVIVVIVQTVDNFYITPKVIGDSVGLKPFWVLVGITVVGALTGSIIGMFLSVPIIAVLLYIADEQIEKFNKKETRRKNEKKKTRVVKKEN